MNENEMKENNEYDYRNGLIMWNKIHSYSINERTRRTLFPNHYIVLGIGYFNEFGRQYNKKFFLETAMKRITEITSFLLIHAQYNGDLRSFDEKFI